MWPKMIASKIYLGTKGKRKITKQTKTKTQTFREQTYGYERGGG